AGAAQAKLYADALEARFNQRPVIFLSNGHRHQIWDDAPIDGGPGYPVRDIAGFYSRADLERIVRRRAIRAPLVGVPVDPQIAGRSYQAQAIEAVAEHLDARQRRA